MSLLENWIAQDSANGGFQTGIHLSINGYYYQCRAANSLFLKSVTSIRSTLQTMTYSISSG